MARDNYKYVRIALLSLLAIAVTAMLQLILQYKVKWYEFPLGITSILVLSLLVFLLDHLYRKKMYEEIPIVLAAVILSLMISIIYRRREHLSTR